jgi:hypothetical protein
MGFSWVDEKEASIVPKFKPLKTNTLLNYKQKSNSYICVKRPNVLILRRTLAMAKARKALASSAQSEGTLTIIYK